MTSKNVLVVANVTAVSDELLVALETLAGAHPAAFTLIAPASPAWGQGDADRERLAAAVERLRAAGLEADGHIGDSDPIVAVSEAWDPRRYDEIIVSTLPAPVSKWLHAALPKRIADLTGALVTHVISRPQPQVEVAPPMRPHEKSTLGPLSVLGWGHSEHP